MSKVQLVINSVLFCGAFTIGYCHKPAVHCLEYNHQSRREITINNKLAAVTTEVKVVQCGDNTIH